LQEVGYKLWFVTHANQDGSLVFALETEDNWVLVEIRLGDGESEHPAIVSRSPKMLENDFPERIKTLVLQLPTFAFLGEGNYYAQRGSSMLSCHEQYDTGVLVVLGIKNLLERSDPIEDKVYTADEVLLARLDLTTMPPPTGPQWSWHGPRDAQSNPGP